MKNVINWTIGSFFRTIGRIIAYIIVGALVAFALSYKPKAATLTSKAVYTDGYWYSGDYNNWGSNNTYNYGEAPLSVNGKAYYNIGNINTTYRGQAYQLAFGFQYNLIAQKYYDITFNFKSRDLTSNLTTSGVHLVSGVSSSTLYDTDYLSLIGVTNNATTGNNTNKLVVRIYAVQPLTYWAIELKADPNNLTSVNNFGIASITIDEVDTTNSQEIINNQTNNTQNIINNQNNTTQQIIDSQNELLGRKCENKFNVNDIINCRISETNGTNMCGVESATINTKNAKNGSINFTLNNEWEGWSTNFISIEPNTNYSFKYGGLDIRHFFNFVYYDSGNNYISFTQNWVDNSGTINFNTPSNASYLRISYSTYETGTYTISNITLSNDNISFCEYGSHSSKLDDTNSSINNLNDTLTDDTTSDTDISNALNNIDVPQTSYGPFQAFLTIPLQWVQTILATGQTCQTLHLPLPFVNRYLDLPCMTDFWNATGVLGVLIQALWIAVVAVRIFNGLFLLTAETFNTNPDSAMELTKIKSWEL